MTSANNLRQPSLCANEDGGFKCANNGLQQYGMSSQVPLLPGAFTFVPYLIP